MITIVPDLTNVDLPGVTLSTSLKMSLRRSESSWKYQKSSVPLGQFPSFLGGIGQLR